jgi:hypothetical protein
MSEHYGNLSSFENSSHFLTTYYDVDMCIGSITMTIAMVGQDFSFERAYEHRQARSFEHRDLMFSVCMQGVALEMTSPVPNLSGPIQQSVPRACSPE